MVTLFDAAQAVRMELATVDADTGELSDGYAASRELFERKGLHAWPTQSTKLPRSKPPRRC